MQAAEKRFGAIDVLVNNAGYRYRAAVEEGDDADIRTLFETHFFGTVAMIKAVLPGMRARCSGGIVNISAIGVQLTPLGSGYYLAAKAAVEDLSGSLHGELAPLGISVTVVEPGAFRTDFAGRSLTQSTTTIGGLRGHGGQATQGIRHRPRHPDGRSREGCKRHHQRRRSGRTPSLPAARHRRANQLPRYRR